MASKVTYEQLYHLFTRQLDRFEAAIVSAVDGERGVELSEERDVLRALYELQRFRVKYLNEVLG